MVSLAQLRAVLLAARRLGVAFALVASVTLSLSIASAQAANITGVWDCCGSGGAGAQDWDITDSGGSLSGEGIVPSDGSEFSTISGSRSGDSVTITTTYTVDVGYVATFVGTVGSDGLSMSGSWTSNEDQSGTWTATSSGFTISGSLLGQTCGDTCSQTGVPNVGVDVVSTDDGGISTSTTSTGTGTWSVIVPAGAYRITPQGDTWNPVYQDETVDDDTPNVNFIECAAEESSSILRWGGPIATAAAGTNPHCTTTTVDCSKNITWPVPVSCTILVVDTDKTDPQVPAGTIKISGYLTSNTNATFATAQAFAIAPTPANTAGTAFVSAQIFFPPGTWYMRVAYTPSSNHLSSAGNTTFTTLPETATPPISLKKRLEIGGTIVNEAGVYTASAGGGIGIRAAMTLNAPLGIVAAWVGGAGAIMQGVGTLELRISTFLNDPPSADYTTVAVPHVPRAPKLPFRSASLAAPVRALLADGLDFEALENVLPTTIDRASSAYAAGNTAARTLQVQAATKYVDEMAAIVTSEMALQQKLAKLFRADHLSNVRVTAGGANLPSSSRTILRALGESPAQIRKFAASVANQKLPRTVDAVDVVASPKLLADERALIKALETFAANPDPQAYPNTPTAFP